MSQKSSGETSQEVLYAVHDSCQLLRRLATKRSVSQCFFSFLGAATGRVQVRRWIVTSLGSSCSPCMDGRWIGWTTLVRYVERFLVGPSVREAPEPLNSLAVSFLFCSSRCRVTCSRIFALLFARGELLVGRSWDAGFADSCRTLFFTDVCVSAILWWALASLLEVSQFLGVGRALSWRFLLC